MYCEAFTYSIISEIGHSEKNYLSEIVLLVMFTKKIMNLLDVYLNLN